MNIFGLALIQFWTIGNFTEKHSDDELFRPLLNGLRLISLGDKFKFNKIINDDIVW